MYAVVEFPATATTPSSIEVVPFKWINEAQTQTKWPPKNQSFKRAVDKLSTPQDSWDTHAIVVKYVSGLILGN